MLLVCGPGKAEKWKMMNPRVLRLGVVEREGDGKEVMFEVNEYAANGRRRVNRDVASRMAASMFLWPSLPSCEEK